jgi:hypothetical protein
MLEDRQLLLLHPMDAIHRAHINRCLDLLLVVKPLIPTHMITKLRQRIVRTNPITD